MDVDSNFYRNFVDNPPSQHRIARSSKGSNKKTFVLKLFWFCNLKAEQHFILQKEIKISERELSSTVDFPRNFL